MQWTGTLTEVTSEPEQPPNPAVEEPAWQSIAADPRLSHTPSPGEPGNVPHGENLRLDIGWDRFEQLLVALASHVLGLNQIKFRRYGVPGQAQHGIDLAGRGSDGEAIVIQCKEYRQFRAADLRNAIELFANGARPFGATHYIVATSSTTAPTQIQDEMARLEAAHTDLQIELWGSDQINDALRSRADIVSRFWTQETATSFCTGAPLPGVAAAPPNWLHLSDQVLQGPLSADEGLQRRLADADALRASDPRTAADQYAEIAALLTGQGFLGHAHVLQRRQLDALTKAEDFEQVTALAALLAATALHEGDLRSAQEMHHRLDRLGRPGLSPDPGATGPPASPQMHRHWELISAAVESARHPLGNHSPLAAALRNMPTGAVASEYEPVLAVLLGDLSAADAVHTPPSPDPSKPSGEASLRHQLSELDDIFAAALTRETQAAGNPDTALRLRLLKAAYDPAEQTTLLSAARTRRLARSRSALVLAAQARRDAVKGLAEDATEHWRQAIGNAIEGGHPEDAADWLYALGSLNLRYQPLTSAMNEEAMLAHNLPKGGSRLIRRVIDPETEAQRAALEGDDQEAIVATRRWLADTLIRSDWMGEDAATTLLGDLYARNTEVDHAAASYLWSGATSRYKALAERVGDHLLPLLPPGVGAWWQQLTNLTGMALQEDLIDDESAAHVLPQLTDLMVQGRAGELTEGPFGSLTVQAIKTACAFAGRGSLEDAARLLDTLAGDVQREPNRSWAHDDEHAQACLDIAAAHAALAFTALGRLLDLAEADVHAAGRALTSRDFLDHLRPPSDSGRAGRALSDEQRLRLCDRLQLMARANRGRADAALSLLSDEPVGDAEVRALAARDRILQRPPAVATAMGFGSTMVDDSFRMRSLPPAEQLPGLNKLLEVAADRNEAATNRQDALTAASNLVLHQDAAIKADVFALSRAYINGDHDGSAWDSMTSNPHPLSLFRVDMGNPSLASAGLRLAVCSATTPEEKAWVRDRAADMFGSSDESVVHAAVSNVIPLGPDVLETFDPTLLAGSSHATVRQLAVIAAMKKPHVYAQVLAKLVHDPNYNVRGVLANEAQRTRHAIAGEPMDPDGSHATLDGVLGSLRHDARHSIRRIAAD